MKYKFKYKNQLNKKTIKERFNSAFSKFLFWLYSTAIYKKLKIGVSVLKYREIMTRVKPEDTVDYSGLLVDSIVYTDIIKIEDVSDFSKEMVKVLTPLKPAFLQIDSVKKSVHSSLREFEESYKTVKYGRIYRGINEYKLLDLIKSISIEYLKGEDSFFIVKYVVEPSEKFNQLLLLQLNKPEHVSVEIVNCKLKYLFSTSNFDSSYRYVHKNSSYFTEALFKEINFQLKDIFLKDLSYGFFKNDATLLFPSIVTMKYDQANFNQFENALYKTLKNGFSRIYSKDDLRIAYEYPNLTRYPTNNMYLFFRERTGDESANGINNIGNLSQEYINSLLPNWMLINIASKEQTKYVSFRKQIFRILRQNKTPLFLKKTLKLKRDLSLQLIDYKRLKKNFLSERVLYYDNTNPLENVVRKCDNPNCIKNHNFHGEITEQTKRSFEEINLSINYLFELLHEVTDIQNLRANMRLQSILLRITLAGLFIAVYASNSEYINSWIEVLLNKFGLKIPRAF